LSLPLTSPPPWSDGEAGALGVQVSDQQLAFTRPGGALSAVDGPMSAEELLWILGASPGGTLAPQLSAFSVPRGYPPRHSEALARTSRCQPTSRLAAPIGVRRQT